MMSPEERAVWLEERRTGIGGSDIATIVGAIIGDDTIYGDPVKVWCEKSGYESPDVDEAKMKKMFWWGHALEPVAAARYTLDTGRKLKEVDGLIRHKKYPHFFASPDRLIVNGSPNRGLEIKTSSEHSPSKKHWGDSGTKKIPAGPFVQAQWYMFVLEYTVWDVISLQDVSDSRIYEIPYDPEIGEFLADEADTFWLRHCIGGTPPPAGTVDMKEFLLKRLYQENNGRRRAATADEIDLMYEYAACTAAEGELKKEKQSFKVQLLESMTGYDAIVTHNHDEFSNRAPKDKIIVDWRKLVKELGGTKDDIDRHTRTEKQSKRVNCGIKVKL